MLLTRKRVDRRSGRYGRSWVATVIRVHQQCRLIGSVLLNEAGRVRRRTPDIPGEVVVKLLVQFGRCGEVAGTVTDRDGEIYSWRVLSGGED